MSQAGATVGSGSVIVTRSGNDWIIAVPNADGSGSKIYKRNEAVVETVKEPELSPAPLPHPRAKILHRDKDHTVFATEPDFRTNEPVQVWIDGHNFTLGNRALVKQAMAHGQYVLVEYQEHKPDDKVFTTRGGLDNLRLILWDGAKARTCITTVERGYSLTGPRFFDGKPWFAVAMDGKEPSKGFRIHWGEKVSETFTSVDYLQSSGDEPIYVTSTSPSGYASCLVRGVMIIDRGEMDSYGKQGECISGCFLLVNGQAAYTRNDVPYHQTPWFDSPKSILLEGKVLGHFSAVYLLWPDGKTLRAVVAGDDGVPTEVSYEIADR